MRMLAAAYIKQLNIDTSWWLGGKINESINVLRTVIVQSHRHSTQLTVKGFFFERAWGLSTRFHVNFPKTEGAGSEEKSDERPSKCKTVR